MKVANLFLLVLVAAGVFLNSISNSFHFDDEHSITENLSIRNLSLVPDYLIDPDHFSRNPGSGMYRPLTLTSYALNYHFSGYDARDYRAVNLILHVASALAAFALVLQLSGQRGLALGAAMLFAVHPVVSEPVNYISARAGSLAAFFSVSAMWLYCRCNARFTASYALALLCFVLALMSKSTAIVTPGILAALSLHVSGRRGKRLWWRGQIAFWIVAFVYLLGMRGLIDEALVQAPVRDMVTQLSTQAKALGYYALLVVVPRGLQVDHQFGCHQCRGHGFLFGLRRLEMRSG